MPEFVVCRACGWLGTADPEYNCPACGKTALDVKDKPQANEGTQTNKGTPVVAPSSPDQSEHVNYVLDQEAWKAPPESAYTFAGHAIGSLVELKQRAYGDSFGRSGAVLRQLWPDGILPDQYADLLTVVRIIDKLFRVANNKHAFNESPYRDIVGYGLLAVVRDENENSTQPPKEGTTTRSDDPTEL